MIGLTTIIMIVLFFIQKDIKSGFVIMGCSLLHILAYFFITRKRKDLAKYVLAFLSIVCANIGHNMAANRYDAYLLGISCALF
jgi:tryptophan-rich sensory protein